MPRGAASRAVLGLLVLIIAIVVAVAPAVDARPKGKKDDNSAPIAVEEPPVDASVPDSPAAGDNGNSGAQTTVPAGDAAGNGRTLLSEDADGDYLPDALDNCPTVQNPDQADSDGDGIGDACPVYQDFDGDGVPDKEDNCPNIATSDFADRDGDGIGDPCDKSPDGIDPTPEPLPAYGGEADSGGSEAAPLVNGEGQDGRSLERDGKSRSKQRTRTETSDPIITTGSDQSTPDTSGDGSVGGDGNTAAEGPDAAPYEPPARDNPRRNEELVAEAAASGELYAAPEPPPPARKAWDVQAIAQDWEVIVRIDAGATGDARPVIPSNFESSSRQSSGARKGNAASNSPDAETGDTSTVRGWMRASQLLQEDVPSEVDPGDDAGNQGSAPVPVENGLVITGVETKKTEDAASGDKKSSGDAAPDTGSSIGAPPAGDVEQRDGGQNGGSRNKENGSRSGRSSGGDGSRRDGSSRAAAAPSRERSQSNAAADKNTTQDKKKTKATEKSSGKNDAAPRAKDHRTQRSERRASGSTAWSDDRDFARGAALDWSGGAAVAGTDDVEIYLTQREGSGTGKRHGFSYAIPVEGGDSYLVRLYFAEPYWGAEGGPEGTSGQRVFSVSAEGDAMIDDLDIYGEAGAMTALIKESEVRVDDGVLNLEFSASVGEPIVAAIEVLRPAK